jgi:hypothetical protein
MRGGAAYAQLSVKRDATGNIVVEVEYMKDGPEGARFMSTLKPIEVGTDNHGDPITSCVIMPTEGNAAVRAATRLTGNQQRFLDIAR